MIIMEVAQHHEKELQAPMHSGSSGARDPKECWVSLRAYANVLHHMIMGQLTLARHHILYHDLYGRYPLPYVLSGK